MALIQHSLPLFNIPSKLQNHKCPFRINPRISCQLSNNSKDDDENKKSNNAVEILKLSVTLTVISTGLSKPAVAAKVAEKKRGAKKIPEGLTLEQLKSWSQDLPVVRDRLPYTEVLNFKEEGKIKHIIKPPKAALRQKPEWGFKDCITSLEGNPKFWSKWDELSIDSLCVNAYSPPVKKPEIPSPYLGFLSRVPIWVYSSFFKPKTMSKKALELKRMREEMKRQRVDELKRMREERETMEKEMKQQKKMEQRKRRMEVQKMKYEQSLREARKNYKRMGTMWADMARDSNVVTGLGVLFFYIFYRTVVLSYRRQRKDYEDRVKIEKAEAEERKKMKELERKMQGLEGEEDEEEGKGGEQNPYMKMASQFMKSGARVRRARHKRPPQFLERDVDVKFADVAGLGKIRLELEEIVKFFTHAEMYRRRGVKIPGGILLCGPPGVGKTLLAKAVAGEAGVNFFSISASQFVEIYVGVGASRVRALYQEAKDNSPAVVFIDELDAVGRERGLIKGSGGQERDATLNQLLVCLDGFEGKGEVITIASTNRPDILDPALVRPGRFDRKIHIPKPSLQGRSCSQKPMAEDVDYVAAASMTDGMVGAELANIVEVAALSMLRDGRNEITTDDLLQAAQLEERGMLDRKERSPELWKRIALNEAAQAVAALNIAPRAGRELGYVRFKMDSVKFKEGMLSRQTLLDHITVQLASRAADEIWYGEDQLSTMWAATADNARSAARSFVLGGLSEKHYGLNNFWIAEKIDDIDLEAQRIVNLCYDRVKKILLQNQKLVNVLVDELIRKKSLAKKEFFDLVEMHGSLEPIAPSLVDIRAEKRKQFQEMITNQGAATASKV
ncbi:putative inactive ATP-dependent zinc metalloprotease FTSHI 2 chloroplastic [Bienertia sinuspersici]